MTGQTTVPASGTTERGGEKAGYLSQSDLFRDLAAAELGALGASLAMTTCHRGRVFYEPGQTGEVLSSSRLGASRCTASPSTERS